MHANAYLDYSRQSTVKLLESSYPQGGLQSGDSAQATPGQTLIMRCSFISPIHHSPQDRVLKRSRQAIARKRKQSCVNINKIGKGSEYLPRAPFLGPSTEKRLVP